MRQQAVNLVLFGALLLIWWIPGASITWGYDYCASNPCLVYDTCRNWKETFDCNCPRDILRTGRLCELDVDDDCSISTRSCTNGRCVGNGFHIATCQDCQGWWSGRRCEVCEWSVCSNGGTCVRDGAGGLKCLCPPGTTGVQCEWTDPCSSPTGSPCETGQLCETVGDNQHVCRCPTGWKGDNCTFDIDECEDNSTESCANGGVCNNTVGSYSCDCTSGFNGHNCTNRLSSCALKVCGSNLDCQKRLENYSCMDSCANAIKECKDHREATLNEGVVVTADRDCAAYHEQFKCLYSQAPICHFAQSHINDVVYYTLKLFHTAWGQGCANRLPEDYRKGTPKGFEVRDDQFFLADPRESVLTDCQQGQWVAGLPVQYVLTLLTTDAEAQHQPWVRLVQTKDPIARTPSKVWSVPLTKICKTAPGKLLSNPEEFPCVYKYTPARATGGVIAHVVYFKVESQVDQSQNSFYGVWWRPNATLLWTKPVTVPWIYGRALPYLYVDNTLVKLTYRDDHVPSKRPGDVTMNHPMVEKTWYNFTLCVPHLFRYAEVSITNEETGDKRASYLGCVQMGVVTALNGPINTAYHVRLRLFFDERGNGCGRRWNVTCYWPGISTVPGFRPADGEVSMEKKLTTSLIPIFCVLAVLCVAMCVMAYRARLETRHLRD